MRHIICRIPGVFVSATALAFALSATLSACGPDTTADRSTSATIDALGGELEADGLRLVVPAGALASDTELTVVRTSGSGPSGYDAFSPVFEFGPDGLTFAQPLTIEIAFEGDSAVAQLFWSSEGAAYSAVGGTVEGSTLSAQITHFSSGFVGTVAAPDDTPDATPDATTGDSGTPDAGIVPGVPHDILSACAYLHLCGTYTWPAGLASVIPSCIEKAMEARMGASILEPRHVAFLERVAACGGSSDTCDSFRLCVHGGEIISCLQHQNRCERSMRVDCRHSSDWFPTLIQCDDEACEQCGQPRQQSDGEACTNEGEVVCNGDVVEECRGSLFRTDCAAAGLICVDPDREGNQASCMPPDTQLCTSPGSPSCDAGTLTYCEPPFVQRIDCRAVGLECSTTAGCVRPEPGTECEDVPAEQGGTCDGDAAVMCMNGRLIRVPCSTVGRTECEQYGNIARCADPDAEEG